MYVGSRLLAYGIAGCIVFPGLVCRRRPGDIGDAPYRLQWRVRNGFSPFSVRASLTVSWTGGACKQSDVTAGNPAAGPADLQAVAAALAVEVDKVAKHVQIREVTNLHGSEVD